MGCSEMASPLNIEERGGSETRTGETHRIGKLGEICSQYPPMG